MNDYMMELIYTIQKHINNKEYAKAIELIDAELEVFGLDDSYFLVLSGLKMKAEIEQASENNPPRDIELAKTRELIVEDFQPDYSAIDKICMPLLKQCQALITEKFKLKSSNKLEYLAFEVGLFVLLEFAIDTEFINLEPKYWCGLVFALFNSNLNMDYIINDYDLDKDRFMDAYYFFKPFVEPSKGF